MISFLAPLLGAGSSGVKSTANHLRLPPRIYTCVRVKKVEGKNPLFLLYPPIFELLHFFLEFL